MEKIGKKMKWENLAKNKCPECNKDFTIGLTIKQKTPENVMIHKCGFMIGQARFREITMNINKRSIENSFTLE